MILPKAIFLNDTIYTDIEIKKPRGRVLADVQEVADSGDIYSAMYIFILGCTDSIYNNTEIVDDQAKLKELVKAMPYRSAEYVAIQIMLLVDPEDYIEGIYSCPRCHKKIIAELKDDIDTRDRISDLPVITETEYEAAFHYDLEVPVKIKSTKDDQILVEVDSVDVRVPTLNDCILSSKQTTAINGIRFQIAMYKNCLIKTNGEPVSAKFKAEWGMLVFESMDQADLKKLFEPIKKYGMKTTVEKRCFECGKVWEATVNTTNFFVSGLQSN